MDFSFIYVIGTLATFATGVGLGAFIENRRISGLRLDALFNEIAGQSIALETRIVRVESTVLRLYQEVENYQIDAGVTQELKAIREEVSHYG